MPDFATLKASIQRHLNDRSGRVFTDDDEIAAALEDALREIALIRDPKSRKELFPREFMAFMATEKANIEVADGDIITLPTASLRILGGRIGSAEIAAVKGMDYEWKKNESISIPTLGEPWLVQRGGVWEVWPVGYWAGDSLKATIRYVKDPPPYESAHPAIVLAMTLFAARNMALDKEQGKLGNLLQARGNAALSSAIGLPLTPQPADQKE